MILAAGRGERMRPLTDTVPKPLLPLAGKPLIAHTIERLVTEGFRDIVINHAWRGEMLETALGDGRALGARICYSAEGTALETGGGVFKALPLLGDDPFVVVNGDIWMDYPFHTLFGRPAALAHVVLVDNPPHNAGGDFHLAGEALRNAGQPRLTFSGLGVYRPALFDGCKPGRFPLAPLLRQAADDGKATGEHFTGPWMDIGTPARLKELEQILVR